MSEAKLSAELTEDYLVIKVPRNKPPKPSASGKNLNVASTYGNQTIEIDGDDFKTITIGVNAYIRPKT